MKIRNTGEALRHEEALILAWIGEITAEKQARLCEIRRRLQRIARAERHKLANAILAQGATQKGFVPETGE